MILVFLTDVLKQVKLLCVVSNYFSFTWPRQSVNLQLIAANE